MNKYLSDKIKVLSFFAIIMVVFLHSYNINVRFASGEIGFNNALNFFIQNLFSNGFTRVAVPIFFTISGYLFFLNHTGKLQEFVNKIKKRTKTLFIPFLFWSIAGILLYFTLQELPQSKNFFTHQPIKEYSLTKLLDTIFINPIPYQLWFIKDLFILVILSPIIYQIIKTLKGFAILALGIIWLELFPFNFYIFATEAVFFFSLGSYLSLYQSHIINRTYKSSKNIIFSALWILLVTISTLLLNHDNAPRETLSQLVYKASIITGIIALYTAFDVAMKNKQTVSKYILNLSAYSFFIYASHEPILTIIKKGMFAVLGSSEAMFLMIYFIAPTITIAISLALGYLLKSKISGLYLFITGGR